MSYYHCGVLYHCDHALNKSVCTYSYFHYHFHSIAIAVENNELMEPKKWENTKKKTQ